MHVDVYYPAYEVNNEDAWVIVRCNGDIAYVDGPLKFRQSESWLAKRTPATVGWLLGHVLSKDSVTLEKHYSELSFEDTLKNTERKSWVR